MSKLVLLTSTSVMDSNNNIYPGIKELISALKKNGDSVFLISHNINKVQDIKIRLGSQVEPVGLTTRSQVRDVVDRSNSSQVVLVGSNDVDVQLTASKKMLLLNPLWSDIQEPKAVKYGFGVTSPLKLYKIIQILNNQSKWFYTLQVDPRTTVYSLTLANTRGNLTQNEHQIIQGFQDLLKDGKTAYYEVLLLHFLASIVNNPRFLDVNIWAIMPSSGTVLNPQMLSFKDKARALMGKKMKEPLFIRHKQAQKSHYMTHTDRIACDRHFDTIHLNPFYKKKLKGKTICIMDDYLTNGTSFEALRNLLYNVGVKNIIFVSLGRFRKSSQIPEFYKQDYILSGDVFSTNYSYQHHSTTTIQGVYDEDAREELKQLHQIITS